MYRRGIFDCFLCIYLYIFIYKISNHLHCFCPKKWKVMTQHSSSVLLFRPLKKCSKHPFKLFKTIFFFFSADVVCSQSSTFHCFAVPIWCSQYKMLTLSLMFSDYYYEYTQIMSCINMTSLSLFLYTQRSFFFCSLVCKSLQSFVKV